MLADGVSKWLRQNSFFARAALVSAGKSIIFRYNNGYKQRLGPLEAKRRQSSDLFSWARVLELVRKRDKQWKRKLGISAVTIRFNSLSESKMQFLTVKHSSKTKQITNWSVSSSKGKLKFFRTVLNLLNMKLELSNFQTSRVLHNSIVHAKA